MHYSVIVWAYIPYKVEKEFTIKASNFSTATARAIKQYRTYLKERNNGRAKKIDSLSLKISKI